MGAAGLATRKSAATSGTGTMAHRTDGSGKPGSGKSGSGKAGSGKAGSGKAGSGKPGSGKTQPGRKDAKGHAPRRPERLPLGVYEAELFRLQAELVALQEWGPQHGGACAGDI